MFDKRRQRASYSLLLAFVVTAMYWLPNDYDAGITEAQESNPNPYIAASVFLLTTLISLRLTYKYRHHVA